MVKSSRQLDVSIGGPARTLAQGEILAFVSGTKGVGQSNLAANLSIQLSRYGYRAALLRAGGLQAAIGTSPSTRPLIGVCTPFEGRLPIDGLRAGGPERLRALCGTCDVVLIDCPSGVAPPVVTCALASDSLIVVTTPEPAVLADTYATLKTLCRHGFAGRAGAVVNMVGSADQAHGALGRLRRATERFLGLSLQNLGYVPLDRHVSQAARGRVPVVTRYPRCSASFCIDEVCRRIVAAAAFAGSPPGLWARAARLFL
jgi:flagellar biosynthesis protein FlhG